MKYRRLTRLGSWALAAFSLGSWVASAHGQATSPALPEITVTGTRLPRIEQEGIQPMVVLRRADIDRSGASTTAQLLQSLPVLHGGTLETASVGPATYGFAGASIHGLGEGYTLVLLNGQRLPSFGGQSPTGFAAAPDLNTLPLSAIERIEILTTGASSIYGADAVAGVINIITRRGQAHNEAQMDLRVPRAGAQEWSLSASTGVGSLAQDGQHLGLAIGALHTTALTGGDRRFARTTEIDFPHEGQRYRRSGALLNVSPANQIDGNGQVFSPSLADTGQCRPGLIVKGLACAYDYARDIDLIPERSRRQALLSYDWQGAQGWHLAADWLVAQADTRVRTTAMPLNLPMFDVTDTLARLDDLGRRQSDDRSSLSHLGLRLEGQWADWRVSSALTHSRSSARSRIANAVGDFSIDALVGAGLYDPLLGPGQQSEEGRQALQAINYRGPWNAGRIDQDSLDVQAHRTLATLPGGTLDLSLGAGVSWERWRAQPSLFAQGLLINPATGELAPDGYGDLRLGDTSTIQPGQAGRRALHVFAEMVAPVSPTWTWQASLRHDRYQASGHAWSGKLGALWRAAPHWLVRASVGTGFRAPTLAQLNAPLQDQFQTAESYSCAELQSAADRLGVDCPASAQPLPQVASGNPALKPERSTHGALGLRIDASPSVSVGADLWVVALRTTIGQVDETLVRQFPSTYANQWVTVPDGSGGQLLALLINGQNLGRSLSSGLDLDVDTRHDTPWGRLSSRTMASVMIKEVVQGYAGGPYLSALGNGDLSAPTLRWRGRWQGTLSQGAWAHTLTVHLQAGYRDRAQTVEVLDAQGQPTGQTADVRLKIPHHLTLDWLSRWQQPATASGRGRWAFSAGVVNLLDQAPPLSLAAPGGGKAFQVGYDERFFDARGRMLVLGARLAF